MSLKSFFESLNIILPSVLVALLFSFVASYPQQVLELYRFTAQSFAQFYHERVSLIGIKEVLIIIALCATFCIMLIGSCMFLMQERKRTSQNETTLSFLSSIIALLPFVAVGAGWIRATIDTASPELRSSLEIGSMLSFSKETSNPAIVKELAKFDVDSQLSLNWWLYLGGSLFIFLGLTMFFVARFAFARSSSVTRIMGRSKNYLFWFSILGPIVISIIIASAPVEIGRALSPFGIICLFFVIITITVVTLVNISEQQHIPILSLLLVCAVVFGMLGWNDNHAIRQIPIKQSQPISSISVGKGFHDWFESRKDRDRYGSKPYPVYIVTAEGGGIYAAYRAATFLSNLQDLCARFSHHVFAISAVSGGSVGAGIYSALTKKIKENESRFAEGKGCTPRASGALFYTDVAERILQGDFLSPVLASFLFPDFLQRFLFFPVPYFDRAIALEKSLEESWDEGARFYQERYPNNWINVENPIRQGFFSQWDPAADTPALFINTTEVASGRGRVITPFHIKSAQFESFPLPGTGVKTSSGDIPLSSSVILSARFPWITPAGWYETSESDGAAQSEPTKGLVYLADGGYFDNSGVITALQVIREIEREMENSRSNLQINLIVLTTAGFSEPSSVVWDYEAPFNTLLSTRYARGRIAIEQGELDFREKPTASFKKLELNGYGYNLPLGWRLSSITRLLILGQNGDPKNCPATTPPKLDTTDCIKAEVIKQMQ